MPLWAYVGPYWDHIGPTLGRMGPISTGMGPRGPARAHAVHETISEITTFLINDPLLTYHVLTTIWQHPTQQPQRS